MCELVGKSFSRHAGKWLNNKRARIKHKTKQEQAEAERLVRPTEARATVPANRTL